MVSSQADTAALCEVIELLKYMTMSHELATESEKKMVPIWQTHEDVRVKWLWNAGERFLLDS